MARRKKWYVSMDYDQEIHVWYGWPNKEKCRRGNAFDDSSGALMILNFLPFIDWGKTIWPQIKPCELKPGECLEIKPPKLELA